ncbi:MAG: hypothetical protein QG570_266 [Patescibacteria group bacterium]|nr:hypothetical protein [Patescibacteria group bacterium]
MHWNSIEWNKKISTIIIHLEMEVRDQNLS